VKKRRSAVWFVLLFSLLCVESGAAQSSDASANAPYWYTLEQGKQLFRGGDYGNALLKFQDAKQQRKELYNSFREKLIRFLSRPDLLPLGDALDKVEGYVAFKKIDEGQKILPQLFRIFPKDSLKNSCKEALAQLITIQAYPEAEYWIGEIFRVEGELNLAIDQYKLAYSLKELLEVPDFSLQILYRLSDLYLIKKQYLDMENSLTAIVQQDSLWTDTDKTYMRTIMFRTLDENGIDRFLTLYRYDNGLMEQAHRRLGIYYYTTGRHPRAVEHLAFAFLIQTTTLIESLQQRQFDYTFTNFKDLLSTIAKKPELIDYVKHVEYYRTLYYLGAALYAVGVQSTAMEVWKNLENQSEAGEWRDRSISQIRRPHVEAVQEKP